MIQLTNWEAALLMAALRRSGTALWDLSTVSREVRSALQRLRDAAQEHDLPEIYSPDCIRGYSCPVCGEFWRAEVRRDPTCCAGWRIYILDPMGEAHPSAGSSYGGRIVVECAERPSPTLGLQYARRHFIHWVAED